MTNRRSFSFRSRALQRRKARGNPDLRGLARRPQLEGLEPRQLMAVGPQLAGIQPNEGSLLTDGQVRSIAPRELVFRFSGLPLDEQTLDAIRITRSGIDGQFAKAVATTDFNTNGAVVMDFTATEPGEASEGVSLVFIKNNLGVGKAPRVSVLADTISVELNSNSSSPTRARELRDTLNNHPEASKLIQASIRLTTNANADIGSPVITYSPLVLDGANAATVSSSFNTGTPLQIKFTARESGPGGNGIRVIVNRSNFGGVAPPRVTVVNRDITITLNSNAANPSTAKDVVDAVNANLGASSLVTASIPVGRSDTVVGTRVTNFSPLVLTGANDIPIVPGYIGLGETPQDVVVRFAENLPDDFYHVEVVGVGAGALRDVDGVAFNDTTDDDIDNGRDFHIDFRLDLGAQIVGVVPQPITRNIALGTLDQARDQIQIFFNQDDLYSQAIRTGDVTPNPTVVDPTFYRLIFTNETLENGDDRVYFPTRVHYDPQTDMAVLTFADDLTRLGSGAGTFRLRVGTNEELALPPLRAATSADPGSSFGTALNVGRTIDVLGSGAVYQEGQTFTVTDQNGTARTFEMDTGFVLRVPANGAAGIADGQSFRVTNGAFSATFEFDQDGLVGPNRTPIFYFGNETAGQIADRIVAAINATAGLALNSVHLGSGRVQLGGTANHTLVTTNSGLTQTGVPGAQTANAIPISFIQSSSVSAAQMAQTLANAINQSVLAVDATVNGDRILLAGSSSVVLSPGLTGLAVRVAQDVVISSAIDPQAFGLDMPGAPDEPGHRDIPIESHYLGGADGQDGVAIGYYNFADVYGFDPQGNPLYNLISEAQKDRTREAFDLYGRYLGIQFVETVSQGLTIATGDLRAVDPTAVTGPGGVLGISGGGLAVMDNAENWDDSFGQADNPAQLSWFETAFHEIGHLLGLGHTYDLPPGTIMGDEPLLALGQQAEAVYPGDADVVHGRYLFRPESKDIDLYRFEVTEAGILSFETYAERLANSSLLDTHINLYRQEPDGSRVLVASNDDYFSHDSFLEVAARPGVYYVGVSASKNAAYDPTIEDSGFGGTTQGQYELRMDFRPTANRVLLDATGTAFDGDLDGVAGGVYNYWFRAQDPLNTIYVDKAAGVTGTGSLGLPYRNLNDALAAAAALPDAIRQQTVIRVVGNGGTDGNLATSADNLAYEIGFSSLGTPLPDGEKLEVPQGVTLMVDAGAVFKLRRAQIVAGSTSPFVDRSASSIQVLGTPRLLDVFGSVIRDTNGNILPGSVTFTSIQDDAVGVDSDSRASSPAAAPGDWGGISFRSDLDHADPSRWSYERRGIFLNYVNYADLRYGGGTVVVDGVAQPVAPIEINGARPTVTFNRVGQSADAAMAASPDSFEETNFHSPTDQLIPFTSDYSRVGPEIYGNTLTSNSLNGLFVRVLTPAGDALRPLTVNGRWDDSDITHVLTETLEIQGNPGGPFREQTPPPVDLVTLTALSGGKLAAGSYNYRITFVDQAGNEGAPSSATRTVAITGEPNQGSIRLDNLPIATGDFVTRRIYRSDDTGNLNGSYALIGEIGANDRSFTDVGGAQGALLQVGLFGLRPRLDARLAIDPGTIVKLNAGAIQTTFGGQLLAEGLPGLPVIMTSAQDDRHGGSGSFDLTNNQQTQVAAPGDWGGLFVGHATKASIDYSVLAFGGGLARIEGGFAGFNTVEVHQADARIAHSRIEFNGSGVGISDQNRSGRGSHDVGAIFVRGAQPIVAGNTFLGNEGPVVSINVNAMNSDLVTDWGRSTYNRGAAQVRGTLGVDAYQGLGDNEGPLVRFNRLDDNAINGMQVRGGTLTTESVWDDTDIVHVVRLSNIVIPDHHTFGGLRMESSAAESLVVKLEGSTDSGSEGLIRATGRPLDIDDRIGGTLEILGMPGFPVVLTSLSDDSVGAGFLPNGMPQVDTNNDGLAEEGGGGGGGGGGSGTLVVATPTNNANLLRDTLLGPGVTPVGNATLVGSTTSAAIFTGGSSSIGIESGIILTTGDASRAGGPNKSDGTTGIASGNGDPDLDTTFNVTTEDTTFLQFDFITDSGNLFFNFVFASEEYNEFSNSSFNDVFAFYVDGQNIAFVPGTNLPISINTVNGGDPLGTNPQNPQYYKNNDPSDAGQFQNEVEYDGFTTVFTATRLGLGPGVHTIKLAISDVFDSALDTAVFLELGSFSDEEAGQSAGAGDWAGIQIDGMANDRNVASVLELEARDRAAPGPNATPSSAQYLGSLAPNEKSGDETLRLGFEVQGLLSESNDVDVYSFDARAGTEVWFDIDRTTQSLDTVIELLNSAGAVIARSDNSVAEANDPSLLFRGTGVAAQNVQPLKKSVFDIPDRYSTNPRDAGMRVVLPGATNSTNTYHVRVRSAGPNLANLQGGLTSGKYQMQIRLREEDEFPGSTVRYSDIRFATTGILVTGQPGHSPLTGEAGETEAPNASGTNNSQATADALGNLLNSDRGALSVAGSLGSAADVDWYRFDLAYDSVQGTVTTNHASVIFDLDYADGIARANSNIWVFDENGNLILRGGDSNVAADRPSPLAGANMDDLSRGSAGPLDPYIGPVALPSSGTTLGGSFLSGRTYYVAVTSNAIMPAELEQFVTPLPSNPFVRVEPVNSLVRNAEDLIGSTGQSNIPNSPNVPVLFDQSSVVPLQLGDLVLYVTQDSGVEQSRLRMVDPFTGAVENTVGIMNANFEDIALNTAEGLFYALNSREFQPTDANTGGLYQIDPRSTNTTALNVLIGDDGIETYIDDPMNPGNAIRANNNNGVGVHFHAMTIGPLGRPAGLTMYAIGNRGDDGFADPQISTRNLLYEINMNTGAAFSNVPPGNRGSQTNPLTWGAWTNITEHGRLDTDNDPFGLGNTVLFGAEATITTPTSTVFNIQDGQMTGGAPMTFTVNNGQGQSFTFEFNTGPEVRLIHLPTGNPATNVTIRDGDRFTLDGAPYEFDTGTVLVVTATGNTINDGDTITITDEPVPDPMNPRPPITRTFEFDLQGGLNNNNNVAIPFTRSDTNAQIITSILSAVNSAQFNSQAVAVGQRISILNESLNNRVTESAGGPTITLEGSPGVRGGAVRIPVEESMDRDQFGAAIDAALNGNPNASWEGDRLNFSGALTADFTEIINRGVFVPTGGDGTVTAGNTAVDFLASDSAATIASRLATAISDNTGIRAVTRGTGVELLDGAFFEDSSANSPLRIGGTAPGGDITGMTTLNGRMFAVSDQGGLFEILAPQSNFAIADYIETATDLLTAGTDVFGNPGPIRFAALATAPANVEAGRYADMLFGIDVDGRLYAFDTTGELQPVFVNGRTSVETGLFNVQGLAFSSLDFNLWHVTDQRRADPGHGGDPVFDGSRVAENDAGNQSIYFGYEGQALNGVSFNRFMEPTTRDNYDFPGGAQGSVISNPFSLEGYAAEDRPTLYFNYFLDTENASALLTDPIGMRDSFRVFASGDDGNWVMLGTNNSARGSGNFDDEYDDLTPFDGVNVQVQELFDVGENGAPSAWRQARISLDALAGQKNVRLRFDFATAGETDTGDPTNTGSELRTLAARFLRDGQTFTLTSNSGSGVSQQTFELDFGYTLVAPTGAAIVDGAYFIIDGQAYEFDSGNGLVDLTRVPILYDVTQAAIDVAGSIQRAILNSPPPLPSFTASLGEELGTNDTLSTAVNTLLTGRAAIFQASGFVGDNVALSNDVDMLRVDLQVGDQLVVDVDTSPFGALFDSALQILDVDGNVLATSLDNPAPDEVASTESYLEYTATRAGTFYIAISGGLNVTYDPINGVLDPNDTEVGSTGPYDITIRVDDNFGIARRDGHRINLPNAADVMQTNLPSNFIEGNPGKAASNVAVAVHINMLAEEVAEQIASALAGAYARGERAAIKSYENMVRLIGTSFLSQSVGPYRGAALGVTSSLPGDQFGEFEASTNFDGTISNGFPGVLRGRDNAQEGVYIDDIVIGFAERGEMIRGGNANTSFVTNGAQPDNEIDVGAYQLELRRGPEFSVSVDPPDPTLILTRSFDTNDPLTKQVQLTAPAGNAIADGTMFSIGDGTHQLTFEFDDQSLTNGVTSGRVRVPFNTSDTAAQIALRIRDAINTPSTQSILAVKAALSDGNATGLQATSNRINLYGNAVVQVTAGGGGDLTADLVASETNDTLLTSVDTGIQAGDNSEFSATGNIGDNSSLTDPALDVDLLGLQLAAGDQIAIDIDASVDGSFLDAVLIVFDSRGVRLAISDDGAAPDERFSLDPYLEFTAPADGTYYLGVSSFANFFYDPAVAGSGALGTSAGDYTIQIGRPTAAAQSLEVRVFDEIGDSNRVREQGQIVLESNVVRESLQFGIEATAQDRTDIQSLAPGAGQLPHPGTPRNTRDVNAQRLAPGVVITNSLLVDNGSGGIRFSGDNATGAAGAVPFGRIVNNTIVGPGGVGIAVENSASPTLLNNILADLDTAITVDAASSSTVIGGSVYQRAPLSPSVGAGSFAINLTDNEPLFVNAAAGNYYLARGSRAIDSAIDSVQDRPQLVNIKTPLGIGLSPIISPTRDALGQRRVDDPTVSTPPGQGASPFKDRGALDRADFVGPSAVLLTPPDNDAARADSDPRDTYVELNNVTLNNFSIQLLDGIEPSDPAQGAGADDASVTANRITVLRDGVKLVQGVDYRFNYDATNNIIRLTPVAGIWELDRIYDILLSNSEGVSMTASSGTSVTDGQQFSVADQNGKVATFEYDSGYTMFVPATYALQIPAAGGGSGGIVDGETFTIGDGTQTVTFEFDSNGAFVQTNKVIPFTVNSSANDLANAIVTAITAARIGLSPANIVNYDGRAVHLGSRANHTVNVSQSSLTLTGQAAGVVDGETFTVDNGTRLVTFEFNATGTVKTGNVAVDFTYANTHEEIAERIETAVRGAQIGLNPSHLDNSNGQVHLGGTPLHVVDVSKSALVLTGTPGAQLAWTLRIPTQNGKINGLADGETFTISNGTTATATFELDNNNQVTPGNVRIAFTTATTPDQLANLLANAIRNANLGLTPTNAGGGLITLGGTANHTINVTNTKLTSLGQPGVPAAVAVPFVPGTVYTPGVRVLEAQYTPEEMAVSIAASINSATAQGLLSNVTATARENEVAISGTSNITGGASVVSQSITDIAGNRLKANRATGETRFTILVGSGLDFGDAPSPYATTKVANGARHVAVSGFFLGNALDADVDGQPNSTATGDDNDGLDDEDGVIFNSLTQGYGGSITVTASKDGVLDAWIDFNGDGDWDDLGERISQNRAITAGQTTFDIAVPGTAMLSTYGRFRLSSTGVATPYGEAPDGEVEDHQVNITANPWRNSQNGLDVNGDGAVSPIDVLLVINEINRNGSRALPNNPTAPPPPPYFDVTGDGFLAPNDAKEIIDYLNTRPASGEGESSDELIADGETIQVAAASLLTKPLNRTRSSDTDSADESTGTSRAMAADATLPTAYPVEVEEVGKVDWDDLLDGIAADVAGERESEDSLDAIFASFPRRLDRFA